MKEIGSKIICEKYPQTHLGTALVVYKSMIAASEEGGGGKIMISKSEIARIEAMADDKKLCNFYKNAMYESVEVVKEQEAEIAKLRADVKMLRESALAVCTQWDTPNWKLQVPTGNLIGHLAAAIRATDYEEKP